MIDITKLNDMYEVRLLLDSDIGMMLDICRGNTLFNQYCRQEPTAELLLDDKHTIPEGSLMINRYYLGLFKGNSLVAMLDYIDEWPKSDYGYLRFFIVDISFQGKQVGTSIIQQFFSYLKSIGRSKVVFGVVADNPQANHFWKKNGCICVDTCALDNLNANIVEKIL